MRTYCWIETTAREMCCRDQVITQRNLSSSLRSPQASTVPDDDSMFKNVVYEFSLNYEMENGVVKKRIMLPKKELFAEIQHFASNNGVFDVELENAQNDMSLKSIYNPDIENIKQMLGMLSIERLSDRNSWRDVIYALSSGGEDMRSLAVWVSKRVPEKYDSFALDQLWQDAKRYQGGARFTLKSIRYWANLDNPMFLQKFEMDTVYSMLTKDVKNKLVFGMIQHTRTIFMFKNKFITDNTSKITDWYEFVTESTTTSTQDSCTSGGTSDPHQTA